jgi:hypothetical protein
MENNENNFEQEERELERGYIIPLIVRINSNSLDNNYEFILNSYWTYLLSDFLQTLNNTYKTDEVLSIEEFEKLEKYTDDIECQICMHNKTDNIKLSCKHIFCSECIKKWLTEHINTCPTCRQPVIIS